MQPPPKNECQRSVNDFRSCILDEVSAMEQRYPMINLSAAFTGKDARDTSPSYNWAPTERQQLF